MYLFFFFSSRRRHTRWNCDWSSDVCSPIWPGEVRATDKHLIGNHPIEQPAAGGLGQVAILVESSVPGRMIDTQCRHVSGIVGNHQLCIARGKVEGGMARRVSGRADEGDPGHHLVL